MSKKSDIENLVKAGMNTESAEFLVDMLEKEKKKPLGIDLEKEWAAYKKEEENKALKAQFTPPNKNGDSFQLDTINALHEEAKRAIEFGMDAEVIEKLKTAHKENKSDAVYTCAYCRTDTSVKILNQSRYYWAHREGEKSFVIICPACTDALIENCGTAIRAEAIARESKGLILIREGVWPEEDTKIKSIVDTMDNILKEVIDS